MNKEDLKLKIGCVLRKAGLSKVPPAILVFCACICVALICLAAYRFWPTHQSGSSENYSVQQAEVSSSAQSASDTSASAAGEIAVDVEGAVKHPGLYNLDAGLRVGDAIDAAGGFKKGAQREAVNLAALLEDGQQICVPTADSGASSSSASSTTAGSSSSASQEKININTATAEELQALQGVGEALSQRIVDYREANGSFSSVEDIQNVSGIGESRFAAIKDQITV